MRILTVAVATALALSCGYADAKGRKHHSETGKFDYYVLSLSWSPVYCEHHPEDGPQCGGAKRFGFVLHGLWPQYTNGGFPESCSTSNRLDPEAQALGRSIFPSEKLVAHEWQRHGTCSGMTAEEYFKTADSARQSVNIPAQLEPGNRTTTMTAASISKAIRDANPSITNRSLAVTCSGPELAEVRVCLGKDLKPMACGSGVHDACRSGAVRVPGVH